jgi:hypothetical protein
VLLLQHFSRCIAAQAALAACCLFGTSWQLCVPVAVTVTVVSSGCVMSRILLSQVELLAPALACGISVSVGLTGVADRTVTPVQH